MGRKGNHPGSNKVEKLVSNTWTEDTVKAAIHIAKEFGVGECTLCFRLKKV